MNARILYFPGCSPESDLREYDLSTKFGHPQTKVGIEGYAAKHFSRYILVGYRNSIEGPLYILLKHREYKTLYVVWDFRVRWERAYWGHYRVRRIYQDCSHRYLSFGEAFPGISEAKMFKYEKAEYHGRDGGRTVSLPPEAEVKAWR